jgi:hypothetical protein
MRIDLYTKTILTVIALLLAAMVLKPMFNPKPVMAQGSFSGIQFNAVGGELYSVDTRTGDVWGWNIENGQIIRHAKLIKIGQPLSTQ